LSSKKRLQAWERATEGINPNRLQLTNQLEFVETWAACEEAMDAENTLERLIEDLDMEGNREGYE